MTKFKFEMGDTVVIGGGAERGTIVARAEYATKINTYLVRYVAGDGCCVEAWWDEDAIAAA